MKLTSITLIVLALFAAPSLQMCDTSCRSSCVVEKKGDECVTSCGCATLGEELIAKFQE